MNRQGSVAIVAALVGVTGCFGESPWSTNTIPKVSRDHIPAAQRVESLGRQIIEQNTFTGLDPLFHVVGVKEPMLFHRGPGELFISEGLVARCRSEAELAAVLCSELGRMQAEQRAAAELGRELDPFPEIGSAASSRPSSQSPSQRATTPHNPELLARDLLRGAGFDPAELERAQPLLRDATRNDAIRKQMAGSAPAPTWNK